MSTAFSSMGETGIHISELFYEANGLDCDLPVRETLTKIRRICSSVWCFSSVVSVKFRTF
jgi:hypothetical protein